MTRISQITLNATTYLRIALENMSRELESINLLDINLQDKNRKAVLLQALGCYLNTLGNHHLACSHFYEIYTMMPNLENYLQMITAIYDSGKLLEVHKSIKESVSNLLISGDYNVALAVSKYGLKFFPNSAALIAQYGEICLRLSRYNEAVDSFTSALAINDTHRDLLILHGNALLLRGNFKERSGNQAQALKDYQLAMQSYEKAYMLYSNDNYVLGSCLNCLKILRHPEFVNFIGNLEAFKRKYDTILTNTRQNIGNNKPNL